MYTLCVFVCVCAKCYCEDYQNLKCEIHNEKLKYITKEQVFKEIN